MILYYFPWFERKIIRKHSWSIGILSIWWQQEHAIDWLKLLDSDDSHRWMYLVIVFLIEYNRLFRNEALNSYSMLLMVVETTCMYSSEIVWRLSAHNKNEYSGRLFIRVVYIVDINCYWCVKVSVDRFLCFGFDNLVYFYIW